MAVSHNATSNAGRGSGVSSQTWSLTVNAGSNRLIEAGITHSGPFDGKTVSSVVFNSTETLSLVPSSGVTNGAIRTELYSRVAPSVTTANVVVTMSGNTSVITSGALVLDGVDPTTPLGTASTLSTSAGGTTITIAPSSGTNEMVLAIVGNDDTGTVTLNALTYAQALWTTSSSSSQEAGGIRQLGSVATCAWSVSAAAQPVVASAVSAKAAASAPDFGRLQTSGFHPKPPWQQLYSVGA